jgi:transcriptional regulator with XRE-family HTH domain
VIHSIIKELDRLRRFNGISMYALSRRLDRSPSWWRNYTTRGKMSSLYSIEKVANIFGLTITLVPLPLDRKNPIDN